jgi:Tetratricopeptide repeat.
MFITNQLEIKNIMGEDWFERGVSYARKRSYDTALSYFDKVIDADPMNARAWNNKGYVLCSLERDEEATELPEGN